MRIESARMVCGMCGRAAIISVEPKDVEMQARVDYALRPMSAEAPE